MKPVDSQQIVDCVIDYVNDAHPRDEPHARTDVTHAAEPAGALVRFLIFLAIGGMLLAASAAIGDLAQSLLRLD